MIEEYSYGVIPIRFTSSIPEMLLICHKKGSFWAFPKGHAEVNESAFVAAERELLEETGLRIRKQLFPEILTEEYSFYSTRGHIHKKVEYFVCEVEGEVQLQPEEVYAAEWLSFQDAYEKATHSEAKRLVQTVIERIADL